MAGGRPIKQCKESKVHPPHNWLAAEGGRPVYVKCDGVAPTQITIEPLTEVAKVFLDQMRQWAKDAIIKSALDAGIGIDEPFMCEVAEDSMGLDIYPKCEANPEGHVKLAYKPDAASEEETKPSGMSWKEAAETLASNAITIQVMPGEERVFAERPGQCYIYVRGSDLPSRLEGVPEGTDLRHIIESLLPEIEAMMRRGAEHYGHNTPHELGMKGQYADMYRKWCVIKRVMWDGEKTAREPLRDILMDMIGHSLLTICMIDSGEAG